MMDLVTLLSQFLVLGYVIFIHRKINLVDGIVFSMMPIVIDHHKRLDKIEQPDNPE
jgi:hypothetical protein